MHIIFIYIYDIVDRLFGAEKYSKSRISVTNISCIELFERVKQFYVNLHLSLTYLQHHRTTRSYDYANVAVTYI